MAFMGTGRLYHQHLMAEATGLRYTTRVLDGGLGLGITMSYIPRMGSPEALTQLLLNELKGKNIVFGLDEGAIHGIMAARSPGTETVVAQGKPPRRGHDADVELVRVPPSFMAIAGEDGRVDYRNVENVSQVKAGEIIARKTPADPGEPGVNIFGKEVRPPAVRDARLPKGKYTMLSDDGLQLLAERDGFLRWRADVIDVVQVYAVTGDVDYRSGNVHYQGDVEIYGSVQSGFEVVAGGDVTVFGTVDGGKVVSDGGSVMVTGGVLGSSEGPGRVTARDDVHIGRARFARLESKAGSVTASYAVEHSEIHAARDLVLRAGPAMSCIVEVGGKVSVADVSARPDLSPDARPEVHSATHGNRRQYVRAVMPEDAPVLLLRNQGAQRTEAALMDLSGGGARIRLTGPLHEGQRFQMQFKLPGVDGTMWMESEVVRVCDPLAERAGAGQSYGVQFIDIEPAIREAIAKFCMAEDLRQRRLLVRA
jgi:hypothetical protein